MSKDIVFYTNAINDNKLYISVAIQHENVALGDPVASVKLKLYLPPSDHIEGEEYDQFYYEDEKASLGQYVSIPLTPSYVTSDGTTIKNYPYTGVQFEENRKMKTFESISGNIEAITSGLSKHKLLCIRDARHDLLSSSKSKS